MAKSYRHPSMLLNKTTEDPDALESAAAVCCKNLVPQAASKLANRQLAGLLLIPVMRSWWSKLCPVVSRSAAFTPAFARDQSVHANALARGQGEDGKAPEEEPAAKHADEGVEPNAAANKLLKMHCAIACTPSRSHSMNHDSRWQGWSSA